MPSTLIDTKTFALERLAKTVKYFTMTRIYLFHISDKFSAHNTHILDLTEIILDSETWLLIYNNKASNLNNGNFLFNQSEVAVDLLTMCTLWMLYGESMSRNPEPLLRREMNSIGRHHLLSPWSNQEGQFSSAIHNNTTEHSSTSDIPQTAPKRIRQSHWHIHKNQNEEQADQDNFSKSPWESRRWDSLPNLEFWREPLHNWTH